VPITEDPVSARVVTDAEGRIQTVNSVAEVLFGYSASEIVGQSITRLFPSGDGASRALPAAGPGGIHTWPVPSRGHQALARRKNGSIVTVDIDVEGSLQDGSRAFQVRVIDIGYRISAERELEIVHRRNSVINTLLRISLLDIPLDQQLEFALDVVLAQNWLPLHGKKGAIFLSEQPDLLSLSVSREFDEAMLQVCSNVGFGECACGLAAQSQQVVCAGRDEGTIAIRYRDNAPPGYYAAPILSNGRCLGVVSLYISNCCSLDREQEAFLETVADTLAGMIERKRAEEATSLLLDENRKLNRKLIELQEEERKALARELHDEMGQTLTAIRTEAAVIAEQSKDEVTPVFHSARAIGQASDHLYKLTHSLIRRLRPTALDDLGLAAAIETLVSDWRSRRPGLPCRLELDDDLQALPEAIKVAIYRFVQEALTNVLRHAAASHVYVAVTRDAGRICVRVEDDGRGLDTNARQRAGRHFGLVGMRERIEGLEGKLEIDSEPNRGLRLKACIPLHSGKGAA